MISFEILQNVFLTHYSNCYRFQAISAERGNAASLNLDEIDSPISITDHLVQLFSAAIDLAFPEATNSLPAIITPVSNPKFGDYQCNSSMQLSKTLATSGTKPLSPRDIAVKILDNLPKSPLVAKCEIAGPGFLNVYLERSYAERALTSILQNGVQPPKFHRQRAIVDFSSPNIGEFGKISSIRIK